MNRFRPPVALLLVLVAVAALDFAALHATLGEFLAYGWVRAITLLTLLLLNVVAFLALTARGRLRVIWGVAALIGGQYCFLSLVGPLPDARIFSSTFAAEVESAAPLEPLAWRLSHRVLAPSPNGGMSVLTWNFRQRQVDQLTWVQSELFVKTVNMITAQILACVAAVLVAVIYRIRDFRRHRSAISRPKS